MVFGKGKDDKREASDDLALTRSALDAAQDPGQDDSVVTRLVQKILDFGIDGVGPLDSAQEFADKALSAAGGDREKAIKRIARRGLVGGGVGGFATGLGGFVTMPVALPANVLEFYVQATRMVAAIAALRGHDLTRPHVRTAVLFTLVGADPDEVLRKAGMVTGSGRVATMALRGLPPAGLMVLNKAIGFRLLRGVGEKAFSRLGRGIPLAGGVIGGGLDAYMMDQIADAARREFPPAPGLQRYVAQPSGELPSKE